MRKEYEFFVHFILQVDCSKKFGQRLAEMLNVPVFLYEKSATRDYRRTLPQIRAGEYEGLEEKV